MQTKTSPVYTNKSSIKRTLSTNQFSWNMAIHRYVLIVLMKTECDLSLVLRMWNNHKGSVTELTFMSPCMVMSQRPLPVCQTIVFGLCFFVVCAFGERLSQPGRGQVNQGDAESTRERLGQPERPSTRERPIQPGRGRVN